MSIFLGLLDTPSYDMEQSVPIEGEDGWALEPVWMLLGQEKNLLPLLVTGPQFVILPACGLVNILTLLS